MTQGELLSVDTSLHVVPSLISKVSEVTVPVPDKAKDTVCTPVIASPELGPLVKLMVTSEPEKLAFLSSSSNSACKLLTVEKKISKHINTDNTRARMIDTRKP